MPLPRQRLLLKLVLLQQPTTWPWPLVLLPFLRWCNILWRTPLLLLLLLLLPLFLLLLSA